MDIKSIIQQAVEYVSKLENMPTRKQIAEVLSIPEATARSIRFLLEHFDKINPAEDATSPPESVKMNKEISSDGSIKITTVSAKINSKESLFEYAGISEDEWIIDRLKINSWEVTMGSLKTETGRPETYTNFQVMAILKPKASGDLSLKERAEQFKELISEYNPKFKNFQIMKRESGVWLQKVSFADQHNGQLSWSPEAGDNWDIKLSTKSLLDGSKYFSSLAKEKKVARILYPAGNDFLNVNSALNTTTHGTPQDEDCRYTKSFKMSLESMIKSIDMLSEIAPVDVEFIGGNHDSERMQYFVIALEMFYRLSKIVKINSSPSFRKYYVWGANLIGLSHGDKENLADIPSIMAMEASKHWAKCKNYYFFHGHLHHEKKLIKEIVDVKKVQVEFDPALVALSAWGKGKGFGAVRKSKANLFHKKWGNVEDVRYFYNGE